MIPTSDNRGRRPRRHSSEATATLPPVTEITGGAAAAPLVSMVLCDSCGHFVPESNMAIHQARACPGKTPRIPLRHDDGDDDDDDDGDERGHVVGGGDHDNDEDFVELLDDHHHNSITAATTTMAASSSPFTSANTTATPGVPLAASAPHGNIIDLTTTPTTMLPPFDDDHDIGEQWACPRCTLFNDIIDPFCAACGSRRPRQQRPRQLLDDDDDDSCRHPDPILRDQLLPDVQWIATTESSPLEISSPTAAAPTTMIVGGGALVGGMLGAAGAFLRGQPVSSAALEGAVTGAVGAAVAQQAWQQTTTPPRLRRSSNATFPRATTITTSPNSSYSDNNGVATARTSASMGIPSYPSLASAPNNASLGTAARRQSTSTPRSSMRVVRRVNPDGSTRMTIYQSGGSSAVRARNTNDNNNNVVDDDDADALLAAVQQFLALSPLFMGSNNNNLNHAHGNMNIDNMSYDQLLEMFGDGSERRGASEATIHSLPTQVLHDPQRDVSKNPELQTCSICLEQYKTGQTRKCLPCLHGFHEDCIDTWLRSNASCPICKHELSRM